MYRCVPVCTFTWVQVLQEAEVSAPPGARAAGGCEWSDTNVRNQIQVPTQLSSYRRRIKDDQTIKAFEEFCTL